MTTTLHFPHVQRPNFKRLAMAGAVAMAAVASVVGIQALTDTTTDTGRSAVTTTNTSVVAPTGATDNSEIISWAQVPLSSLTGASPARFGTISSAPDIAGSTDVPLSALTGLTPSSTGTVSSTSVNAGAVDMSEFVKWAEENYPGLAGLSPASFGTVSTDTTYPGAYGLSPTGTDTVSTDTANQASWAQGEYPGAYGLSPASVGVVPTAPETSVSTSSTGGLNPAAAASQGPAASVAVDQYEPYPTEAPATSDGIIARHNFGSDVEWVEANGG